MATMLMYCKAEHSSGSAHKLKQLEVPGEGRVSLVHRPVALLVYLQELTSSCPKAQRVT